MWGTLNMSDVGVLLLCRLSTGALLDLSNECLHFPPTKDVWGRVLNANLLLLQWSVFVYYSLSLKSLHLKSFAFTLKRELERFSESSGRLNIT